MNQNESRDTSEEISHDSIMDRGGYALPGEVINFLARFGLNWQEMLPVLCRMQFANVGEVLQFGKQNIEIFPEQLTPSILRDYVHYVTTIIGIVDYCRNVLDLVKYIDLPTFRNNLSNAYFSQISFSPSGFRQHMFGIQ